METINLDLTCYSGGAEGADMHFDRMGRNFGVTTHHLSYKTGFHSDVMKLEIDKSEFEEGKQKVLAANDVLKRPSVNRYMKLLSRNFAIIKRVPLVLAVGKKILKKGTRSNPSVYDIVMGGTGYAVLMACLEGDKRVYVFDQSASRWFDWSPKTNAFREYPGTPVIDTAVFAGIGTREISEGGKEAIRKTYEKTILWKANASQNKSI